MSHIDLGSLQSGNRSYDRPKSWGCKTFTIAFYGLPSSLFGVILGSKHLLKFLSLQLFVYVNYLINTFAQPQHYIEIKHASFVSGLSPPSNITSQKLYNVQGHTVQGQLLFGVLVYSLSQPSFFEGWLGTPKQVHRSDHFH